MILLDRVKLETFKTACPDLKYFQHISEEIKKSIEVSIMTYSINDFLAKSMQNQLLKLEDRGLVTFNILKTKQISILYKYSLFSHAYQILLKVLLIF